MAMMISSSPSRSRFVPAIYSVYLHFLENSVLSTTTTKARVCSCPRSQFLASLIQTKQFSNRSRDRDNSRDRDLDREVREVVALFKKQLYDSDPRPSVKEFTRLLSVISRKKHYFQVISLYKLMCRSRIQSDSYTMNIVINCYCKISKLDSAMGIFKEMEEGTCKPNVVSYNTLINGFCKAGKVDDALGLVKKMEEQSFTPNVVTYTALIGGLCKAGNFNAALDLLRKMEEGGVEPEKISYFTLINGLSRIGKTDVALELQEKLKGGTTGEVRNRLRVNVRKADAEKDESVGVVNLAL